MEPLTIFLFNIVDLVYGTGIFHWPWFVFTRNVTLQMRVFPLPESDPVVFHLNSPVQILKISNLKRFGFR